ncbi:MAG: hypothetical protein ABSB89_09615 [Candidatus Bathyarchaeia archaeon]
MSNLLSRFAKKVKFWLFEERDDIYAENLKRRKQLHNAHLIQVFIVLIGIGTMALIPLVLWFITKGFVFVYLIFTAVAGILYLSIDSYVKHVNKQYELN